MSLGFFLIWNPKWNGNGIEVANHLGTRQQNEDTCAYIEAWMVKTLSAGHFNTGCMLNTDYILSWATQKLTSTHANQNQKIKLCGLNEIHTFDLETV